MLDHKPNNPAFSKAPSASTDPTTERETLLRSLGLPQRVVFLDVDDTLVKVGGRFEDLDPKLLSLFRSQTARLKLLGCEIGLGSDSPQPQLARLASWLGISGPIIAENGSLVSYSGKVAALESFETCAALRQEILATAKELPHYRQMTDCTSRQFGGDAVIFELNEWAFGADRQASVSVFGPAAFLQQIVDRMGGEKPGMDCAYESNFLAFHPAQDFRRAKAQTLAEISKTGVEVVMIGNSLSDWVEPEHRVHCLLVGNATADVKATGALVSKLDYFAGVLDCLTRISVCDGIFRVTSE